MNRSIRWFIYSLLIASLAWSQPGGNMTILTATMKADPAAAVAGEAVRLDVHLSITDGLHINSHTPAQDFLIPLELTVAPDAGLEIEGIDFPTPLMKASPAW